MAQWRGRLGTPASGRHSPPKAGGGKDSPFRGGPFSAGVSAFGGIRTREWQTPFVAVRATCLHSVKADGKEPPVTLGVAVSGPTGKNPHDRVLRTPRREENGRHSRWPGAASSSLVSRSRACRPEAGPVLPVGAPSRPCHGAVGHTPSHLLGGYVPRREPSRRLGPSPPRPCGPLCRPEAGVPSRPRHGAAGYTPSHLLGGYVPRREPSRRLGPSPPRPCGPLCRPEAGVPSRPRHGAVSSTRSRVHPRCRRALAAAIHGNRWEIGVPHPHPVTAISARALRVTGIPVSRLRCLGVRCGP